MPGAPASTPLASTGHVTDQTSHEETGLSHALSSCNTTETKAQHSNCMQHYKLGTPHCSTLKRLDINMEHQSHPKVTAGNIYPAFTLLYPSTLWLGWDRVGPCHRLSLPHRNQFCDKENFSPDKLCLEVETRQTDWLWLNTRPDRPDQTDQTRPTRPDRPDQPDQTSHEKTMAMNTKVIFTWSFIQVGGFFLLLTLPQFILPLIYHSTKYLQDEILCWAVINSFKSQ